MNTKKCQFCGNGLLANKEQCHYCGEWLNNNESTNVATEMIATCDTPWYGHFAKTCIFAVLFTLMFAGSLIMGLVPPFTELDLFSLLFIAYLLYGLRKHYTATQSNRSIPFITTIGVTALLFFCYVTIISDRLFSLFNPDNNIFLIIFTLLCFVWYVLLFIIGFKLFKKLKTAPYVGIIMMIFAVVMFITDAYLEFVAFIGHIPIFVLYPKMFWALILIKPILTIVFFIALYIFFSTMHKEERDYATRYPR